MVSEQSHGKAADVTYQDWISSYETWRDIGDKCAMHGLFSLAADLYGQGLVRDRRAFLRSSLWFKFAKSCFRCGRTSDAQLAVKVSPQISLSLSLSVMLII
jgi:dienelactone hydrolase